MKGLVLIFCFLCSLCQADELPNPYVAKGACPGEGCSYGNWLAKKEIPIYAKESKDSKILGLLKSGQIFEATTGNVYVNPGLGKIQHIPGDPEELSNLNKDMPVYILDYIGEGYTQILQGGKKYSAYLGNVTYVNNGTLCASKPDPDWCWLEIIKQPVSTWWVKIKFKNLTGWIVVEDGDVSQPDSGLE